ncbi:DNA polymerase-3 subunit epsilon [Pseudidiomarina planktonica]|uniref:DNA polymerase III subunit epsilon n=1 Tax=Pseudidiomarina planktonica TaxID=1323738 RepID=A0A1Y6EZS3_9GAMM|nr:DNA polymerase III subunit epsilon [Pseudidiomarina planktonica]RUO65070.1 DNA polymerase III subunit epsilon [Pseudidiomarina planktonica]SMQ66801.1 DNA polymerase-3 subunit epsilon [Pseudidiomarina planktonica]
MRQIVLDTETTGLDPKQGHRIIEIGCIEVIDRKRTGNHFHVYINPERLVEQEAIDVHGITNEFLQDKPIFGQIADDFFDFIKGGELVIHNAPFDVGFMDHEFAAFGSKYGTTAQHCKILDTLQMARQLRPGQKNNLDALCRAFSVDNSGRDFHGALLDAELLADVYLAMTGGQRKLDLAAKAKQQGEGDARGIIRLTNKPELKIIPASADEEVAHRERLDVVEAEGGSCRWSQS